MSSWFASPRGRALLSPLTARRVLVAFDFDGTLAPIVVDPSRARLRRSTRKLLAEVARRYDCAVISGRARADVAARVAGVPLAAIVGNHGIEQSEREPRPSPHVRRWRAALAAMASEPGVWVEDKSHSLSVHFRRARDKTRARRAISRALRSVEGARVVRGKDVINVLPSTAPDKGQAALRLQRRLGCEGVLFVGDDQTDEEAFSLTGPRFVGVRVGMARRTAAPLHLRAQGEIDDLLALLLALRNERSRAHGT